MEASGPSAAASAEPRKGCQCRGSLANHCWHPATAQAHREPREHQLRDCFCTHNRITTGEKKSRERLSMHQRGLREGWAGVSFSQALLAEEPRREGLLALEEGCRVHCPGDKHWGKLGGAGSREESKAKPGANNLV